MMNDFTEDTVGRKAMQILIMDRTLTTEITGDFSLPDYQPEIKRLLRIGTNVLPPNRFAGSNGAELQGMLDYFVLYMGHDNNVYCAPLAAEYSLQAEPDAEGRSLLSTAGEPFICICDAMAEPPVGRVTAPRRLNIRCRIKADVKLYGEYPLENEFNEDATLEQLTETVEIGRTYWGLGETMPLQDDVILSPSDGEWRVVCAEGKVMITEATPSIGSVACRGDVALKLTLCPAESEAAFSSDAEEVHGSPALTILQRKIPFSYTVEAEGVTPSCAAAACGYCTDISVEMEDGHLHVELGMVGEIRAQKNEAVTYVKDLYSIRREDDCRYSTYPALHALHALNGNFTLSDSQALSEVGIDPASIIADVTAVAQPEGLTADRAKGRCLLTGICRCHLLLLRDGEYSSADMTLPFRYEFDDPALLRAESTAPDPHFDGAVTVVNCRARMDGERVGVDAELAVALRTHASKPLTVLAEPNFGDEVSRRRGEYVICFPAPTDTLWSVAKRYHAPMAALTAANNLPSGANVDSRESLEGIGYLIV